MSYAIEELRSGIVEMFSEQPSRYFCAYHERDGFILKEGNGTSRYRCEICGSMSETHRCVIPDRIPPENFSCWTPPVSAQRQERLRIASQVRYQQTKKLSEGPRRAPRLIACETCGSRAPEHRCIDTMVTYP